MVAIASEKNKYTIFVRKTAGYAASECRRHILLNKSILKGTVMTEKVYNV